MKSFTFFISVFFSFSIFAQPTTDYVVQTWAEINSSPPKITVHWNPVNGANNYFVYKKLKSGTNWGNPIANLVGSITNYEDNDVELGVSYEYKIKKTGNVEGYGYINSGIDIAPVHHRGRMLLLVD